MRIPLLAMLPTTLMFASPAFAADTHVVETAARSQLTVGKPGAVSVAIQGRNGWHVNEEAPITLKLTAPAGVTVDKDKFSRGDLAESTKERARFDVHVTCAEPGSKAISAEARFVMCQESACKPVTEKLTLALDATDAAPATGTSGSAGKAPSKKSRRK